MELRQAHQSVQPFRTQDEYLYAMKEDLAEWLHGLYDIDIGVNDFFERLENGVVICRHGNNVHHHMLRASDRKPRERRTSADPQEVQRDRDRDLAIQYRTNVRPGTFQSRDNISNFIGWCRSTLQIPDTLLFETDDLVLRKNERNVVLCLLEVARRGSKFGLPVPVLVQLEQEIDDEIAAEEAQIDSISSATTKRRYPAIKVDMKSLDELVREVLGRCTCPDQFPMIRVSDGKYKIGDSLTMIFLRILRSHVMVRIGGGWDTLENYLNRHDPCRCVWKSGHGLYNAWNVSAAKENSTPAQKYRENNLNCTAFTPESKKSGDSAEATRLSTDKTTPAFRMASSFNEIDSAHPKTIFDEVKPKPRPLSGDSDKHFCTSPNNLIAEQNSSGNKVLNSGKTVSTNNRTNDREHLSVERDSGGFGRERTLPTDSSYTENRTRSSERPSGGRRQMLGRSAPGIRARSVDPFDRGGTADAVPERRRSLSRSSSKERTGGESKKDGVLIITRDQRGLHRVQDLPRNGTENYKTEKMSLNNGAASHEQLKNPKMKSPKGKMNATRLLPSKPSGLQRSLSGPLENKMEEEGFEIRKGTMQGGKPSTYSSTTTLKNPSVELTAEMNPGFRDPLSPTKSEFLFEEYRKFELGIQNLINSADEPIGTDKPNRTCDQTESRVKETEYLQDIDTSVCLKKQFLEPIEILVSKEPMGSLVSKEPISNSVQTNHRLDSSRNSVLMSDCGLREADVCDSVGLRRGTEGGTSEGPKRKLKEPGKSPSRHLSCTRTESSKTLTPVRSASANRSPQSAGRRTRSRTREENVGAKGTSIGTWTPARTSDDSENLSGHRSRTASARNRDRKLSLNDGYRSGHTSLASASDQSTEIQEDRSRPGQLPIGAGEGSRLDAKDTREFLLNWNDYRRRVLVRKEDDQCQGQRSSTRIPMPLEVKDSVLCNQQQRKDLERLDCFDSGVDINN